MTKHANERVSKKLSVSALALAAALAIGTPAFAQAGSGSIQGDVEGATAGQTVTFTDTVTGQRISATVGADGHYVATGLRPSTYTVQVGSSEPQTVTLPVGQTVTVNFSSGAQDEIVVTGVRNREVRTATVNTNVTPFQIETLPTVSRNFLDSAALAPSITVTNDFTSNNKRMQAGGVAANNINVFIDGVSNKDQVGFNGVAGQSFSQGNPFPQSAIQEFQVQVQNFKAEYEQAGSAIITAVTKTGGEEFHGGAYYTYIPEDWFGQPFFDRGNPRQAFQRQQYGVNLGGPIVPGVLHFFADYEVTRSQYPGATINLTDELVPEEFLTENGTPLGKFDQDNYFAKLTWFAGDANTVNLSYYKREETDIRDFGGIVIRSAGRNVGTQSETVQLDWTYRAGDWVNYASLSRFQNNTGTPTISSGPNFVLLNGDGAEILFAGAHFFTQANVAEHTTFKEELTYTGFDDHVIKVGFRYNKATLTRDESWAGNGRYFFSAADTGNAGWAPFASFQTSIPVRSEIAVIATPTSATDNQYGVFIQDDWTIDDHWTLNYGIRWDYEDNAFNNDYVTPAPIAEALRNYTNWQAAGIDPENYITDGSKRDPFMGAFQPRIGVSYDVNGDRETVLFAGAGRYYDRNIFYLASLETSTNSQVIPTVNFCNGAVAGQGLPACDDPDLANPLQWNESFRDADTLRAAVPTDIKGSIWVINNDAKVPYTDQFDIGIRQRFGNWQTSATIAYNHTQNGFIFVRGNRMPDGRYTDGGLAFVRDNFPPEGQVPGHSGRVDIGSSKGEFKYLALYLTADKPYDEESGWGATATLTVSDSQSNQAQAFGEAEMFNAGAQDAFGWQDTAGLEDWRFVGTAIVDLPLDFQLSGVLTLSSGPSFGHIDFDRKPPECDGTPPEPDEGGCFYVNNSGVFSPGDFIAFQNLDLRLSRTFKTWEGHELTIDADVFNVFDSVNRNYSTWGAGCCDATPPLIENATTGYARTYQIGIRYSW